MTSAQEPAKPPDRVIYVPYDDWDQVLKSDAKGVLLTRDEFERMRRRADANRLGTRPAGAVLESATHEARVDGDAVRGTATFVIKSSQAGTSLLPLALDGIGVTRATIGTAPALLGRDGAALVVAVDGAGTHTLVIEYTLPVADAPDGRRVAWQLPRAPAGTLRLAIPGDNEVHVEGAVAGTRRDGDVTRTDIVLGGIERVGVRFRSKLDQAPRDAVVEARADTVCDLRARDALVIWDIHFSAHRAPVQEFVVPTPAGWVLTEVTVPELERWNVADARLTVRLRSPSEKPVRLIVRMERLLDASGTLQVPFPAPEGLLRREGRCFVRAEEGVRVRPLASVALREEAIDPRWRRDRPIHQFAYAADAPRLDLSVEVPAPKLTSGMNALVYVDEDEAWADVTWDIAVAEGRLFEVVLPLPAGVTPVRVDGVRGVAVRWEVRSARDGADRSLAVTPAQPVNPGGALTFIARLRRDFAVQPAAVTPLPWLLPPLPGEPEPGNVRVGIATHPAYRVREAGPRVGCEPISPQVVRERIDHPDLRLGYELTRADGRVPLEIEEETPRVELQVTHVARWKDNTVRVEAWLGYRIKAGALRAVQFRLPAGTGAAVDIRGAGVAEKSLAAGPDGDTWTVRFAEKQRDAAGLYVAFSGSHGINATRAVPLVRGVDVADVDGRLAIETADRMELDVQPTEMRTVDPGAVALGELSASGRLLAAFRYSSDRARCDVTTRRFENGRVAPLVVLHASTIHHADPDRGSVTEVTWTLAEVGEQKVALPMPEGATLLSLTVDGKPEKPTEKPGAIEVRLPGALSNSRVIRLMYHDPEATVGALSTVSAEGAAIAGGAVPVLANSVQVVVPSEFRALRAGGSMRLTRPLAGRALLREIYETRPGLAVIGTLALVALLALWTWRAAVLAALPRPRLSYAAIGGGLALLLLVVLAIPGTMRSRLGTSRDVAPAASRPPRESRKFKLTGQLETPRDRYDQRAAGDDDHRESEDSEEFVDQLEQAEPTEGAATMGARVRELAKGEAPPPPAAAPRPEPARKPGAPEPDEPPIEDPVVKDAEEPMPEKEAPADRPAEGKALDDIQRQDLGAGVGGGAAGRVGGKRRAQTGTVLAVGGTGAIAGLQALDLRYALTAGESYGFAGHTAGGTAWVWIASDGLLRGLAFVAFLAALALPFLAASRRNAVLAAVPAALLAFTLLPEWAPGLAPACNAGVIGLIVGFGALLAARLLRSARRELVGAAAAALLAVAALGAPARAQEPGPKIPGDGKIYVPYDPKDIGKPGGKPGDLGSKVYLPYDAFLKLFADAHPERMPARLRTAVAGHVRAAYDVTLDGVWLTGTAQFEARSVGEGWVELPLGFAGAQVESATVEGLPAPLHALPDGSVGVLLPAPGKFRVEAKFRVRGEGTAIEGLAPLGLAATPVATLQLRVADASLRAKIEGAQGAVRTDDGGGTRASTVSADLGAATACKIKWEPRSAARASEGSSVSAETRTEVHAGEGVSNVRVRARYRVAGGERDAFRFALGADVTVLDVVGANVRGWTIEGAAPDRVLVARMNLPVRDATEFEVRAALRHTDATGARTLPRVEPLGLNRETGVVALVVPGHLRWSLTDLRDASRVEADRLREQGWLDPSAGFRFSRRPFTLAYDTAPEAPRLSGTIEVGATLRPSHLDLTANLTWRSRAGSGVFAATATLPASFEVRTVTGNALRTWWLDPPADGRRRLRLVFADGADARAVQVLGRAPFGATDTPLTLPVIELDDVERQQGQVVVIPDAGRDLRVEATKGLTPLDAGALGVGARALAFRFQDAGWSGTLAVTPLAARRSVEWLTHSVVAAAGADHSLFVTMQIDVAPVSTVSIEVPGDATGIEVEVEGLREVRQVTAGGRTRLDVTLQEPFLGTLTLGVFAHTSVATEGAAQALFRPAFPGVDADRVRGWLLLQPLETQARLVPEGVVAAELRDVRPGEVPDPTGVLDRRRVTHAWQVTAAAFSGTVKLERLVAERGAAISVDLMELETVLAREGVARTRATLHVQNREWQYLDVTLPAGSELLSLMVDGRAERPSVAPGAAANVVKVPLPRRARGDLGFTVVLQWQRADASLGNLGTVRPAPPVLPAGVNVAEITWTVWLPDEFGVLSVSGNMAEAAQRAQLQTLKAEKQQTRTQELLNIAQRGEAAEAERATGNLRAQLGAWNAQIEEAEVGQHAAVQAQADEDFLRKNATRLAQQREEYRKVADKLDEVEADARTRQVAESATEQEKALKSNLAAFKQKAAEKKADGDRYQEQAQQEEQAGEERRSRLGRIGYAQQAAPQQGPAQDPATKWPAPTTGSYAYAPTTYFPTYYPTTPAPTSTTTTPTTPTGPTAPTAPGMPTGPGGPTAPSGGPTPGFAGFAGGPDGARVQAGGDAGPSGSFTLTGQLATTRAGALSLDFAIPAAGHARHFRVQGSTAELEMRLTRAETWGLSGDLLRWLAVIALFLVVRRRGWFGASDLGLFPQVVIAVALSVAAGAALAHWGVAFAILVLCTVDWRMAKRAAAGAF